MRNIITVVLLLTAMICQSQTTYYTTDGKNILTESEVKAMLSGMEAKMEKVLGKKMYANLTIQENITKKDSIISKVSVNLSNKKHESLFKSGPLSVFKNKPFPAFDLATLDGTNFNSKQLNGKPTLINFWFTKCPPCIDEMPVLNEIAERYKASFNFIAITYEKKEDVKSFLKKHPFKFSHLINAQSFIDSLNIPSYPMNLFLDKNGVLRYVEGGIAYESKEGEELKMGKGDALIKIIEKLK